MVSINGYKAKALECLKKANDAYSGDTRRQWIDLALAYIRLAELADRNAAVVVVHGTPQAVRPSIQ